MQLGLLDACCWRQLWWGGLTPVGDCHLVRRGPPAGCLSDAGLAAAVARGLPVASGEDDVDRLRVTAYRSSRCHFYNATPPRPFSNFE